MGLHILNQRSSQSNQAWGEEHWHLKVNEEHIFPTPLSCHRSFSKQRSTIEKEYAQVGVDIHGHVKESVLWGVCGTNRIMEFVKLCTCT